MEDCLQPSWLDNSILTTILHSVEPNTTDLKVLEWTCKHAVPEGSNYLSLLYRVSVHYQKGQGTDVSSSNIIIKKPLESGSIKEFMDKTEGYQKEVYMYKEILPAMYDLHDYRLTARSFHCPLHNSLALEDLKEQGYIMADRLKQLDPAHCRLSLAALARFHAMSVRLLKECLHLLEYYRKQINLEDKLMQDEFIKYGLKAMYESVGELKGSEKYAEMIKDKINTITGIMGEINKATYGLEVLCHGDAWTNNILFKYSRAGQAIDIKLVDFQMSRTSSFAIDILYFWWSSADLNTRENHKDKMFEVYRTTLNQTLEELGCHELIISKEKLDKAIAFYAPFSLEVISGILPVVMADPENLAALSDCNMDDMNKPPSKDSEISKNYYSKYYKGVLPKILQQVEKLGAFSNLEDIQKARTL